LLYGIGINNKRLSGGNRRRHENVEIGGITGAFKNRYSTMVTPTLLRRNAAMVTARHVLRARCAGGYSSASNVEKVTVDSAARIESVGG